MMSEVFGLIGSLCKDVRANVSLSAVSTFKIGGPASTAAYPTSEDELISVVRACLDNDIPFRVIGAGSNVLFPDEGLDGVTVFTARLDGLSRDKNVVTAGAGVSLISLCRFCLAESLGGLEFAYGIPGTVGGGLFMNCGAYGGEIKEVLLDVRYYDVDTKRVVTLGAGGCAMSHRHSVFEDNGGIIMSARFTLAEGDSDAIKARMDELMMRRREKQPTDMPSAGSFFKRPEGAFASALIDQCGLKGLRVGGAMVSDKHAGFIVNVGGATSRDVRELAELVRRKVSEESGYMLEPEVRYL